jgi:peptide/nickel transport system permease protein
VGGNNSSTPLALLPDPGNGADTADNWTLEEVALVTPISVTEQDTTNPMDVPEPDKKIEGKSPSALALERFRKDKLSMISFVVVCLYILAAVLAPVLVGTGVLDPLTQHQNMLDQLTLPKGHLGGMSWHHPLGIEPGLGRDALSRVWYGLTFSLVISVLSAIFTVGIGTVMGIISGFSRTWADPVIGRIIDLTLSFPQTLMLLALHDTVLQLLTKYLHIPVGVPSQMVFVVLVLTVFGWPSVARLIRGQVLSLREREFVDAAVLMGSTKRRIYFTELLPNLWGPILVNFTLTMPAYISTEAALGYLGVTIKPPTPTLGTVMTDSLAYAQTDVVYFLAPAFLLALIVICFNLLGDGLGDALDPKRNR